MGVSSWSEETRNTHSLKQRGSTGLLSKVEAVLCQFVYDRQSFSYHMYLNMFYSSVPLAVCTVLNILCCYGFDPSGTHWLSLAAVTQCFPTQTVCNVPRALQVENKSLLSQTPATTVRRAHKNFFLPNDFYYLIASVQQLYKHCIY